MSPTGGEDLSISAEPEGVDGVRVAFELSKHHPVANVPQKNSAIGGSRSQELPIGREGQRMDGTLEDKSGRLAEWWSMQEWMLFAVLGLFSIFNSGGRKGNSLNSITLL